MAVETYVMPYDAPDQQKVGGEGTAKDWYATRSGGYVVARGKENTLTLQFATSGTYSNPTGWTSEVTLQNAASNVPADNLNNAINAEFVNSTGSRVIIFRTGTDTGSNSMEIQIGSSWDNFWHPYSQ